MKTSLVPSPLLVGVSGAVIYPAYNPGPKVELWTTFLRTCMTQLLNYTTIFESNGS